MNYKMKTLFLFALTVAVSVLLQISSANAGEEGPMTLTQDTNMLIGEPIDASSIPVVRLTPNKTKVIRLEQNAASVIVANPRHASVLLDTPRVLVVMPRAPGTTSFTVMDANGDTILKRDVIISGRSTSRTSNNNYVRVRRVCNSRDRDCVPRTLYYCPDGCHEVAADTIASASTSVDVPDIVGNSAPIDIDTSTE